jgi:hypothetical protein
VVNNAPGMKWPYGYELVILAMVVGLCANGSWTVAFMGYLAWRGVKLLKP